MPNSAGVEVGRISVRVSPDTKRFRSELKRGLDRIERDLKAEIKVDGKFDGAGVKADFDRTMGQLRAEGARGFTIHGRVDIDRSALDRLPKNLPGGGGGIPLGGGVGGMGMLAVAAAAIAAIGPAIALLSGALFTLPGLLIGIGAPALLLAGNIDKIKEAFAGLQPLIDRVNDSFVNGFLSGQNMTIFGETVNVIQAGLATILKAVEGPIGRIGESLASAFRGVIQGVISGGGLESLTTLLNNIADGFKAAVPGITDFTNSFLKIAAAMTGKGMVEAFNQAAVSFGKFVDEITAVPEGGGPSILQDVLAGLLGVVKEFGKGGFDLIKQGIEQMSKPEFVQNMKDMVSGLFQLIQTAASFGNFLTSIQGVVNFFLGPMYLVLRVFKEIGNAVNLLKAPLSAVFTVLGSIGPAIGKAVSEFMRFSSMGQLLSGAFNAVKALFSDLVGVIGSVQNGFRNAANAVIQFGSNLISQMAAAWNGAVVAVQTGIDQVVSFVSELPGKVQAGLGNLGSFLVESGKALIQGFIDGMLSMVGAAVGAAGRVLSSIRNLFPFSPAKEGPFSGKGWVYYSGLSIGEGLADGLKDSTSAVKAAASDVMQALDKELFSGNSGGFDWKGQLSDLGKTSMEMPFDIVDSNIKQFMGDMGMSGGGVLGAAMDYGRDFANTAASNIFNFNVSNVDEAIAVKNNQVNKQSLGFVSR